MNDVTAIIVAAGKGTRMGGEVDKLFLEIAGLPVIGHTWKLFDRSPEVRDLVIVIREGMEEEFGKLAKKLSLTKPYSLVMGGHERQDSVWNGLQALPADRQIVAIHDGARPCTKKEVIQLAVAAAREFGAAVAAQKITDTLKEATHETFISRNVDRSKLWCVQTPQAFRVEVIKRALKEVFQRNLVVTDDTAACELIGQKVKLVECAWPNPKLTTPADLAYFEFLLSKNSQLS